MSTDGSKPDAPDAPDGYHHNPGSSQTVSQLSQANDSESPQGLNRASATATSNTHLETPAGQKEHNISGNGHNDQTSTMSSSYGGTHPSPSKDDQQPPIEQVPPPAFSQTYGHVDISQDGIDTNARIADDGRVNIHINQKSRWLSELLAPALRSQFKIEHGQKQAAKKTDSALSSFGGLAGHVPPMNIVIHVVGSRGDVQPFVALGQVLKRTHGHRVRLATHPTFRTFVEENELEFFSIGGDPAELMAFMVKNPGLMPGIDSLRAGDVGKRRKGMYEIIQGCWRSCIEIGDGTGERASDDNVDRRSSLDSAIDVSGDSSTRPFIADAIIANPPSFAHIHCAERLGIPLHLMFTMPWSPTQAFPHPLTNIQSSNADASITNFVSYALVEMMTWQGLGDVINRFREDSLGLEPVSLMWAPGMASRLRIPYTYCWSPALIPKPKDWGDHISISGFYFLSLASKFTPEPELEAFLNAGPPPVYIGFGSIVVDDPNAMTKLIFDAVRKTGQRALVSKGWGGLGADALGVPEGVFMLGNVPHDWLFKHVSCVVHHGGAGTTATGISMGKPTVVVPFFGDQPFWGAMVARAGAGPTPISSKHLTSDNLAAAILEALKPSARERAQDLAKSINEEPGNQIGAQSFHDKLDIDNMRCMLAPKRTAAWRVKRTKIRLSPFAATTLGHEGLLDLSDLKLYRPMEYDSEDGPWDPISGGASALIGTLGSLAMGFADFPVEVLKAFRFRPKEESKSQGDAQTLTQSATTSSTSSPSHNDFANVKEDERKSANTPTEKPSHVPESTQATLTVNPKIPLSSAPSNTSSNENHIRDGKHNAPSQTISRDDMNSPEKVSAPKSPPPGILHADSLHNLHRSFSGSQAGHIPLDAAVGAGKGIGRIVEVGLKSPMDFTLSLARGFHNAPKLYGDESVRQAERITGIQSGLKAAGKGFGLGLYDGISGLITQPYEGAKREGVAGLIKGFGKGIGGVVLKPNAAFWGLPGYTFKGIYKELQKHFGSSVQNYIVAGRTAQGHEDWKRSTPEERLEVVQRWHDIQVELKKEQHQARHGSTHTPHNFLKSRHSSMDARKSSGKDRKKSRREQDPKATPGKHNESKGDGTPLQHAQTFPSPYIMHSDNETLEEAVLRSVAATSKGDSNQDAIIARAIRASVLELRSAAKEGDHDEALERAIQASIAEAARVSDEHLQEEPASKVAKFKKGDHQLRAALHRSVSMHDQVASEAAQHPLSQADLDDSGVESDDHTDESRHQPIS